MVSKIDTASIMDFKSLSQENRQLKCKKKTRSYGCSIEGKPHVLTKDLHQNPLKYIILNPKLIWAENIGVRWVIKSC